MMIIAEAGINHDGNLDTAMELARMAKDSGADAVKYQTFWHIRRFKDYEFTKKEWIKLKEYCDNIDITFLSTPHTFEAIHFLDDLVPIHKIASVYMYNPNFLVEVNSKNKPIILSTGNMISDDGMSRIKEVENALKYLDIERVTLMICQSKYPSDNIDIHREDYFRKLGCSSIGLSDHSKIIKIPKYQVIEKHFMLKDMDCIDKNVSLTPDQFKEMVKWLKQ